MIDVEIIIKHIDLDYYKCENELLIIEQLIGVLSYNFSFYKYNQ